MVMVQTGLGRTDGESMGHSSALPISPKQESTTQKAGDDVVIPIITVSLSKVQVDENDASCTSRTEQGRKQRGLTLPPVTTKRASAERPKALLLHNASPSNNVTTQVDKGPIKGLSRVATSSGGSTLQRRSFVQRSTASDILKKSRNEASIVSTSTLGLSTPRLVVNTSPVSALLLGRPIVVAKAVDNPQAGKSLNNPSCTLGAGRPALTNEAVCQQLPQSPLTVTTPTSAITTSAPAPTNASNPLFKYYLAASNYFGAEIESLLRHRANNGSVFSSQLAQTNGVSSPTTVCIPTHPRIVLALSNPDEEIKTTAAVSPTNSRPESCLSTPIAQAGIPCQVVKQVKRLPTQLQIPPRNLLPTPTFHYRRIHPKGATGFADVTGRYILAADHASDWSGLPLSLLYFDGEFRHATLRIVAEVFRMRNLTRPVSLPPRYIAELQVGSFGLNNIHIIGNKALMDRHLRERLKTSPSLTVSGFLPWTSTFRTIDRKLEAFIREICSAPSSDISPVATGDQHLKQYLIFKPSGGQQQRGVLVVARDIRSVPTILAHIRSTTLPGGPYIDWVCQSYIRYPFLVSGQALGSFSVLPPAPSGYVEPCIRRLVPMKAPVKKPKVAIIPSANSSVPPPSSSLSCGSQSVPNALSNSLGTPDSVSFAPAPPLQGHLPDLVRYAAESDESLWQPRMLDGLVFPDPSTSLYMNPTSESLSHTEGPIGSTWVPQNISPTATQARRQPSNGVLNNRALPDDRPSSKSPSATPQVPSTFPSDSGTMLIRDRMYKVHFRVYAALYHSMDQPRKYSLFMCRLFKLYHSIQPYDPMGTAFESSVSKYLGHRMGNQILSQPFIDHIMRQFIAVIRQVVRSALERGGFTPFGIARSGLQMLGWDFLYDTTTHQVVLLEVNTNLGQGIVKRETLTEQGMSPTMHDKIYQYWVNAYRLPFIHDLLATAYLQNPIDTPQRQQILPTIVGFNRNESVWQEICVFNLKRVVFPRIEDHTCDQAVGSQDFPVPKHWPSHYTAALAPLFEWENSLSSFEEAPLPCQGFHVDVTMRVLKDYQCPNALSPYPLSECQPTHLRNAYPPQSSSHWSPSKASDDSQTPSRPYNRMLARPLNFAGILPTAQATASAPRSKSTQLQRMQTVAITSTNLQRSVPASLVPTRLSSVPSPPAQSQLTPITTSAHTTVRQESRSAHSPSDTSRATAATKQSIDEGLSEPAILDLSSVLSPQTSRS